MKTTKKELYEIAPTANLGYERNYVNSLGLGRLSFFDGGTIEE